MAHFSYEKQLNEKKTADKAVQNISSQDARQGRQGTQMRNVLMISLILAAIIWFGLEIYGTMINTNENMSANGNIIKQNSKPPVPAE